MARRISRRRATLLVSGGLLLAAAGCAPATTSDHSVPAPTGEPPTVQAERPTTPTPSRAVAPSAGKPSARKRAVRLRLWLPATSMDRDGVAWYLMSRERGYQAERGVDVEFVPVSSNADIIRGVLSGDLDIGIAGASAVAGAVGKAADIRIIGTASDRPDVVLVARRDIPSFAGLRGKVIGTGGSDSLPYILALAAAEKLKVDSALLDFKDSGPSTATLQALRAGNVDAGFVPFQSIPEVEQDPTLRILFDPNDVIPEAIDQVFFARTELIRRRQDLLTQVLTAMALGFRHAYDQREETIALAARTLGKHPADLEWSIDYQIRKQLFDPNVSFSAESLRAIQAWNLKAHLQERALPVEQLATWDVNQDVLAAIGRVPRR